MATTVRGPRSCKLGRMSRRRYRCGSRGDLRTGRGGWLWYCDRQRSVARCAPGLARIPKEDADQAREAQLARLQALRLLFWNHAGADPIKAAEALIKLEAREARLLGLDMPVPA